MAADGDTRPVVDLLIEDARWEVAGLPALADRAVRATLAAEGFDPAGCEVSLLAADDARLAELNRDFRGKDGPTNVLSWPAFEGDDPAALRAAIAGAPTVGSEAVFLGDVALAYETCAAEAAERGIPLRDHVAHLVVHGLLHLLGHDHEDDPEATRMEAVETKTLATLGVRDPYRE